MWAGHGPTLRGEATSEPPPRRGAETAKGVQGSPDGGERVLLKIRMNINMSRVLVQVLRMRYDKAEPLGDPLYV